MRNTGTKVVHRYVREGLRLVLKKSDILRLNEEQLVLENEGASIDHLRGLNSKMGYFLCHNSFIQNRMNFVPSMQINSKSTLIEMGKSFSGITSNFYW